MNLDRFSHGLPDTQEKELKAIDECAGCGEDIFEGDDILERFHLMIHDDAECCHLFLQGISLQKIAE